ncbi:hypothetical protein EST38_g5273 [Candolleomyces aberdarensis]|uniref:DNA replication complex GINS protein PSF1 n=1 Tax=Candolleomyces aberdarensis TaxID=2316362 RepID=A0A4Q2DKY0_9AGAR|nr:hypothetical protein EST38_g5273 [Candolleomyces aberdarensis]
MADTRQYGDLATQLLLESRRSTQTDTLAKYNDPLVRSLIREQRELERAADTLVETEQNARGPPPPGLLIIQTAINRNKRCLLAYHTHRLSMLQNLYWACGGALPHLLTNSDLRSRMSPHEVDYLRQYNASLMEFRSDFTYELDVMSGIEKPPKEIHVRVRVVRECGVVQTENGSIDFKRGERYVVRRADVENLIVQGFLEEV